MHPYPLSTEQLELLTELLAVRFDVLCEHLAEIADEGRPATDYREEAVELHAAVAAAARWSRVPSGYHAAFARTIHLGRRMRRRDAASRADVERVVRMTIPAEFVAHVMSEIYPLGEDAPTALQTRPRAEAA